MLEGLTIAAEASAKEAVTGLDATFAALVSRTAQLLAGRLPGMSGGERTGWPGMSGGERAGWPGMSGGEGTGWPGMSGGETA